VLPKAQLDIQQCSSWAAQQLASTEEQLLGGSSSSSSTPADSGTGGAVQEERQQQCAVVCCDQGYLHLLPQLQEAMLMAFQVNTVTVTAVVFVCLQVSACCLLSWIMLMQLGQDQRLYKTLGAVHVHTALQQWPSNDCWC
jgi:hypothetical protein